MNEPKPKYFVPAIMRQKLTQADENLLPVAARSSALVDELDKFHTLVDGTRDLIQDAIEVLKSIRNDFQNLHDDLLVDVSKLPETSEKAAISAKLEQMLERVGEI